MSDLNIIYKPEIISLFNSNFSEIKNMYNSKNFDWDNLKSSFDSILKILLSTTDENTFIKYYYLVTIFYINYTNYLKYSSHPDFNNQQIYKYINNLKFNNKIIEKIIKFSSNKNIKKILKIFNPFILIKSRKINDQNYVQKLIKDYVENTKQMELFFDMKNDNIKKILNIIIYRYVISKDNKYISYDDFYKKRIIGTDNNDLVLNMENFIKQIPFTKNILNIRTKNGDFSLGISVDEVLNFVLEKFNKITFFKENGAYHITNKKYGGKITIKIEPTNKTMEFNINQLNYTLVHYSIEQIKEFGFLKKTESNIEIKLGSNKIKDYTGLIDFIHILIISLKNLETYPTDLYECIYPNDYNNYYFLSFCIFFEYVKSSIKKNNGLNKFIIDLVKFLYIYSYYDFYFYYSNNLLETIIENYTYKNNIFEDFTSNLKTTLKIPKELFAFPPFFNINDDINSIVYYNFEIPSYYKYFDLINAICYVFDKDYYKKNKNSSVIDILSKYFNISLTETNEPEKKPIQEINKNNIKDINQVNLTNKIKPSGSNPNLKTNNKVDESSSTIDPNISDSKTSSDRLSELKSRLDSDILANFTKEEKNQMTNKNTYIELNVENSINCVFITDK